MCCFADARSVRVFILDWRCFGISKVQHQLNEEITDKEIRLIGENGEQLGIVSGEEALRTAEETVSAEMGKLTGGMGLGF